MIYIPIYFAMGFIWACFLRRNGAYKNPDECLCFFISVFLWPFEMLLNVFVKIINTITPIFHKLTDPKTIENDKPEPGLDIKHIKRQEKLDKHGKPRHFAPLPHTNPNERE